MSMSATTRILVGICAMDKKARSRPMQEILSRIPDTEFEVIIFGNDCILHSDVKDWPAVECLIAFYSDGFPLTKAIDYITLRRPFEVNCMEAQFTLLNRLSVYRTLEANGIVVPKYVVVNDPATSSIAEYDDYVVINGVRLNKPLVEKPVDAEDHNIYIYYPMSEGGGSKRLFRKTANGRCSDIYPNDNSLRKEGGPFMYEELILTDGNDIKVYMVGDCYGHAEIRTSPVADGIVRRDSESGLAVRSEVELTEEEKLICHKVFKAFRQNVCGFDILRSQNGGSVVIDVNGWSFVKSSSKYIANCSRILMDIMRQGVMEKRAKCNSDVPSAMLEESASIDIKCDDVSDTDMEPQRSVALGYDTRSTTEESSISLKSEGAVTTATVTAFEDIII